MKRLTATLLSLFVGLLCLVPAASAAAVDVLKPVCSDPNNSQVSYSKVCQDNKPAGDNPLFGPKGVLTIVVQWLARIVGVIAVIVVVASGMTLVISGGDTNQATTARRTITYAAIALGVAAFAQAIVSFVLNKL